MKMSYLPFDFATQPNVNRRETEREYFMRMIREQQVERAQAKRQERARKIKSALNKTVGMLQLKRTQSLENLFCR